MTFTNLLIDNGIDWTPEHHNNHHNHHHQHPNFLSSRHKTHTHTPTQCSPKNLELVSLNLKQCNHLIKYWILLIIDGTITVDKKKRF